MSKFRMKFSALLACLLVIVSVGTYGVPANATEAASEFDFSSFDNLDKYDSYKKTDIETADGKTLSGVQMVITNDYDSASDARSPEKNRYSAYLRSNDEVQRYFFYNLDGRVSTTSTMWNNTLTIYADPDVQFTVADYNGNLVVNSIGYQNKSLVHYYKTSTENNHKIYYIELEPKASGKSRCLVEFSTTSSTAQPHYSMWFGSPLIRSATKEGYSFSLSVSYPNSASTSVTVRAPYSIPERAWVDTITINKVSSSGNDYLHRVNLNITLPGNALNSHSKLMTPSDTSVIFEDRPNHVISHNATGPFKLSLSKAKWNSLIPSNSIYMYQGSMTIHYVYAVGA